MKYYTGNETKTAALDQLYGAYEAAVRGDDGIENAGGFSFVWGCGDVDAEVVLVGEAPGKDEVRLGRPFVGKAGGILDGFLEATGISRDNLFITNTVKYRLARRKKGAADDSSLANRPAKPFEVETGARLLRRECTVLAPRILVTLGNVPLKAAGLAMETDCFRGGVGECHGKPEEFSLNGRPILVFPLYHPASLIYNPGNREVYGSDLEKLKEWVRKLC